MAVGSINVSVPYSSYNPSLKSDDKELNEEELKQVKELKKRDQEVKAHEAAHMAAGGAYVRGGASYSYQAGPDGKRYAVGGEVSIDTSTVSGDPEATIQKMRIVKQAALAPADPSGQDRSVAAAASAAESKARQELIEQRKNEQSETESKNEVKIKSSSDPASEKSSGINHYDTAGCVANNTQYSEIIDIYV